MAVGMTLMLGSLTTFFPYIITNFVQDNIYRSANSFYIVFFGTLVGLFTAGFLLCVSTDRWSF